METTQVVEQKAATRKAAKKQVKITIPRVAYMRIFELKADGVYRRRDEALAAMVEAALNAGVTIPKKEKKERVKRTIYPGDKVEQSLYIDMALHQRVCRLCEKPENIYISTGRTIVEAYYRLLIAGAELV